MTLAEFKAVVPPSQTARDAIAELDDQMMAAINTRKPPMSSAWTRCSGSLTASAATRRCEYSTLYEALGYVRKSERKSGLTRKGKGEQAR